MPNPLAFVGGGAALTAAARAADKANGGGGPPFRRLWVRPRRGVSGGVAGGGAAHRARSKAGGGGRRGGAVRVRPSAQEQGEARGGRAARLAAPGVAVGADAPKEKRQRAAEERAAAQAALLAPLVWICHITHISRRRHSVAPHPLTTTASTGYQYLSIAQPSRNRRIRPRPRATHVTRGDALHCAVTSRPGRWTRAHHHWPRRDEPTRARAARTQTGSRLRCRSP